MRSDEEWDRYVAEGQPGGAVFFPALAAIAAAALLAVAITVLVATAPPPGVLGVAKAWLFCDASTTQSLKIGGAILVAGCP